MTKLNEIYKCEICGNIVEMVHTGAGELVCCGQAMSLQKENTVDADKEKHVPVITENDEGILVSIGEKDHPMEKEHYIEWIEIEANKKIYRKYFEPGDEPKAEFTIKADNIKARAYCNIHGLWVS
jgi:superoxide reductase